MGDTPGNGHLSEAEEAYIRRQPSHQQAEIFDAQDAWDQVLGPDTRPVASKLNEMLSVLRDRRGLGGTALKETFEVCCTTTAACRSMRAAGGEEFDPIAWTLAALKEGRYPPRKGRSP